MRSYKSDDDTTKKETRILDGFSPRTDILIYGTSKVIIASFYEQTGIIIDSADIHAVFEQIFAQQWNSIKN
jgi:2-phosphoglycerate kinase